MAYWKIRKNMDGWVPFCSETFAWPPPGPEDVEPKVGISALWTFAVWWSPQHWNVLMGVINMYKLYKPSKIGALWYWGSHIYNSMGTWWPCHFLFPILTRVMYQLASAWPVGKLINHSTNLMTSGVRLATQEIPKFLQPPGFVKKMIYHKK